VLNNPLSTVDPLGLDTTAYQWIGNCLYESDATSSTTTGPGGTIVMSVTWSPWSLLWCGGGDGYPAGEGAGAPVEAAHGTRPATRPAALKVQANMPQRAKLRGVCRWHPSRRDRYRHSR
jgi:hypothetical protein